MRIDNNISSFNISKEDIPEVVADKIFEFHILPMQEVCDDMPVCVCVSGLSGWRSYDWEVSKNRSGRSEHCFGQRKDKTFDEKAKGAVDWTCDDFQTNKDLLLDKMIKHTEYTRFCMYKTFIHADYKDVGNERQLFFNKQVGEKKKWVLEKVLIL